MSTDLSLEAARAKWPGNAATLPSGFQAVYQTWMTLRVQEMKSTPGAPAVGERRINKSERAREMTLARTPFPAGTPSPPVLLTTAQIDAFGAGGTPDPAPVSGGGGGGELSELRRLVQDQQISIEKLLRQQEALADDKDATSAYQVCEETLSKFPVSFRAAVPMSRVDRRHLRRDHGGAYPKDGLPKELTLPEDVKNEKNVAAHKISLVALTKDVVSPLMDGNMEVLRMAGTVHSRIFELHTEMAAAIAENGDDAVVSVADVLGELDLTVGAASASMDLIIDLHARLRTVITSRVERAMGFADLHDDPNKRSKETFLSEDFQLKIEEKAKEKAHMAWAKSGTGGPPRGSLHGQPPPKKSGGGGSYKKSGNGKPASNGGRGNGPKGGGKSSGKPAGKGGGRGKVADGSSSNE